MTEPTGPRVVSYGGGVQSTALLVLAAQGRINFQTFLMANVGDDSEHPDTLAYVRDHAAPYAAAHGIDLHILQKKVRGEVQTLHHRMTRDGSRSLPIPVRYSAGGPPVSRACTAGWKVEVTGRWMKQHGASDGKRCREHIAEDRANEVTSSKARPRPGCPDCVQPVQAVNALGISLDEISRANTDRANAYEKIVYPLIDMGEPTGLMLRRDDCARIIREASLPVPRKSSCYFCPFNTMLSWADLRRDTPDLFEKSAQLEEHLTNTRAARGQGPVFLTTTGIPLREAVGTQQDLLFDDGGCESGVCFV